MKKVVLAGLILALVGCSDDKPVESTQKAVADSTVADVKANSATTSEPVDPNLLKHFPKFKIEDIISYPHQGFVCLTKDYLGEATDYLVHHKVTKFTAMFEKRPEFGGDVACMFVPPTTKLKIIDIAGTSDTFQVLEVVGVNKIESSGVWGLNYEAKLEKSK